MYSTLGALQGLAGLGRVLLEHFTRNANSKHLKNQNIILITLIKSLGNTTLPPEIPTVRVPDGDVSDVKFLEQLILGVN